jgi:hypothetical protein
VTIALAIINVVYVILAGIGFWRGREASWLTLFAFFVVIRSLFLGTLENPEPRYTLECYPVVMVLAAVAVLGARTGGYQNPN